ncbi:MAG: hypothetical protein WA614_02375 [Acidimicrobiales bacterium]|jgi:diadenosine tetraphosphate (Ap4A) HIT family hydrolase
MSTKPESPASSEDSVVIGPGPYFHRSDCNICRKQDGLKTSSALLDVPMPGGYVVNDEHFLVEHAPIQESSAGTMIVEARRHFLDFGEMTTTDSTELGSILHRIVPAIKAATGVDRVYYFAIMEHAPHFHLWLIPRKVDSELRGPAYLAQQPPLSATFADAEAMAKKIRAGFEST